jgi:hypothetical protein
MKNSQKFKNKRWRVLIQVIKMQCSLTHGNLIAFGVGKEVIIYRASEMTEGREIARIKFNFLY